MKLKNKEQRLYPQGAANLLKLAAEWPLGFWGVDRLGILKIQRRKDFVIPRMTISPKPAFDFLASSLPRLAVAKVDSSA